MPGGQAYWTVLDEAFEVAELFDGFLRWLRLVNGRAESTTRQYASAFAEWAACSGGPSSDMSQVSHQRQTDQRLETEGFRDDRTLATGSLGLPLGCDGSASTVPE